MTVISRTQQTCCNYPSSSNSDTESFNLGSATVSDTESLNNEPTTRGPRKPLKIVQFEEEPVGLKKSSGKKKTRRYLNRCILQTLVEEDELEEVPRLIEPYKSPFMRLLEDQNALEFWNDFIEKSQDEQAVIMESLGQKEEKCLKNEGKTISPFARISGKIKRTLKIRNKHAKELLGGMEGDMISFFCETPDGVYIKEPANSFERLLLHAVAQYHNLNSISVLTEGSKIVEVESQSTDWIPADTYLSDVITHGKS